MRLAKVLIPGFAAFAFLGLAPKAHADGREPGSILIFPEFDNRAGDVTMFTVTNTNEDRTYDPQTGLPRGTVTVHFVYIGRVDSNGGTIPCLEVDREVTLTPTDTFTFMTKAHNPSQNQGFMYCYAQNPQTRDPISFNYLIGNALFVSGIDAIDYSTNPISLESERDEGCRTNTDQDFEVILDLDGDEYERLPSDILIPRFLATGGALRSELILMNLSGGAQFNATAEMKIYNDNEEVFSAQREFRCWERVPLDVISPLFTNTFLKSTNHAPNEPLGATARESGWIDLDGGVAYSSVEQIDDPAVYAVLIERVSRGSAAADLPFEEGERNGDLWPTGIWGDGPPGVHDNQ